MPLDTPTGAKKSDRRLGSIDPYHPATDASSYHEYTNAERGRLSVNQHGIQRMKRKLYHAQEAIRQALEVIEQLDASNSEMREQISTLRGVISVMREKNNQARKSANTQLRQTHSEVDETQKKLDEFDLAESTTSRVVKPLAQDDASKTTEYHHYSHYTDTRIVQCTSVELPQLLNWYRQKLNRDKNVSVRRLQTDWNSTGIPTRDPSQRASISSPPFSSALSGTPSKTSIKSRLAAPGIHRGIGPTTGHVPRSPGVIDSCIGSNVSLSSSVGLTRSASVSPGRPSKDVMEKHITQTKSQDSAKEKIPSADPNGTSEERQPESTTAKAHLPEVDSEKNQDNLSTISLRESPEVAPSIFNNGILLDVLYGLGITSSRHFDDSLLTPNDYSYSYQFKMYRQPQRLLKFKDFAPKVFSQIRQHWNISNIDILLSFRYDNLEPVSGKGKSGACFIFTRDLQFLLKTSTGPERDLLWEILPFYFLHIRKNPNTLLPRFYGVYSMKHEGFGGVMRFTIANNCFNVISPIETYDIKGSIVGRTSAMSQVSQTTTSPRQEKKVAGRHPLIFKDLDIQRSFNIDDSLYEQLIAQLQSDTEFLATHNIMDYSLLVGVIPASKVNEREHSIKRQCSSAHVGSSGNGADQPSHRRLGGGFCSIFQQTYGGVSGMSPDGVPEIYYFGIIDILQTYSGRKKLEHFFKSIPYNAGDISIVEPTYYARRLVNFVESITKPCSIPK